MGGERKRRRERVSVCIFNDESRALDLDRGTISGFETSVAVILLSEAVLCYDTASR